MSNLQWWPVDNPSVISGWGTFPEFYAKYGQRGHNGYDMPKGLGTPVYSVDDGVVFQEGWNIPWSGEAGGIACILRHDTYHSGYAHFSATVVSPGQSVARGQLLGYVGATGAALGYHLHNEILPLVPNFNNGFSGRVNPATIVNYQPRGTTLPTPPPLAEVGRSMYSLYWTGPTTANTHITGRIITDYGSFGIPNMQVFNLLQRRYNASFSQNTRDEMLDAEHAIIDNFLNLCFQSRLSGVKFDAAKFRSAVTDALKAHGQNIVYNVDTVFSTEDMQTLSKAVEDAGERITKKFLTTLSDKLK